jgi:hypothetical protein
LNGEASEQHDLSIAQPAQFLTPRLRDYHLDLRRFWTSLADAGDNATTIREREAAEFDTQLPYALDAESESVMLIAIYGEEGRRIHLRATPRALEVVPDSAIVNGIIDKVHWIVQIDTVRCNLMQFSANGNRTRVLRQAQDDSPGRSRLILDSPFLYGFFKF